jgi:rubrerythrin
MATMMKKKQEEVVDIGDEYQCPECNTTFYAKKTPKHCPECGCAFE